MNDKVKKTASIFMRSVVDRCEVTPRGEEVEMIKDTGKVYKGSNLEFRCFE